MGCAGFSAVSNRSVTKKKLAFAKQSLTCGSPAKENMAQSDPLFLMKTN
jgi:hypothetical protein